MSRYGNSSLVVVAALCCALAGCSSQSSSSSIPNPFAQADRVPAPPTRVPAPGQAVPNYGGWPGGTPAAPASYPGVAPAAPMNGFGGAPAINAEQFAGGGAVGIPTDNQSLRFEALPPSLEQPIVELAARSLPPGTNLGGPATFVPPVNVTPAVTPRVRMPQGNTFASEPITPSTYQVAGQIRQRPAIMELPPQQQNFNAAVVDQTADGFRARGAARDMMGAIEPTLPSGFGQPATMTPQVGYGYGPTYQQLRGRLEFSPAIGYWKLRYIPIDGATDEFGGSMILANPEALQGFQAGDWIMVEGTPQATQNATGAYTALFTISSIVRQ